MKHISYKEEVKELLTDSGLYKVPVKLSDVLGHLHISLVADERSYDDEVFGEINFDKRVIWVNPRQGINRERFTIAHEIGHFQIEKERTGTKKEHRKEIMRRDGNWDMDEYKANKYAAELLMPYDLLKEEGSKLVEVLKQQKYGKEMYYDNYKSFLEDLTEELAKRFEVSCEAMKYRLRNTGLFRKPVHSK